VTKLKHTRILRGGITARRWTIETTQCNVDFRRDQSIALSFNLASKGGGTTSVLVEIGLEDVPLILEGIATHWPASIDMLAAATTQAGRQALSLLEIQQRKASAAVLAIEAMEVPLGRAARAFYEDYLTAELGSPQERRALELNELVTQTSEQMADVAWRLDD
jgi:hypothetical protein